MTGSNLYLSYSSFIVSIYHSLTNQTEESIEKGNKQKMPENEIIFL